MQFSHKYERTKGFVKNETKSFATLSKEHKSSDDDDDDDAEGEPGRWVSKPLKYRSTTLTLFHNRYVTRI